jgi:hypothetical protein
MLFKTQVILAEAAELVIGKQFCHNKSAHRNSLYVLSFLFLIDAKLGFIAKFVSQYLLLLFL